MDEAIMNIIINDLSDVAKCREYGVVIFQSKTNSDEEKAKALELVKHAAQQGDAEANYWLGIWILTNRVKVVESDSVELGYSYLCCAANRGYMPARYFLDKTCEMRYKFTKDESRANYMGPLLDFNGKEIKIACKGIMSPVDAKLEYINGVNTLTFYTNIMFIETDCEVTIQKEFYQSVLKGIKDWEGEYEVFGGQKLQLKVEITEEDRLFDNVYILPMTRNINNEISNIAEKIGTGKMKKRVEDYIRQKRSSAGIGFRKWSIHSRKIIMLQSENGKFDDYNEIRSVVKHEFGHVLGLGDLYYSPLDNLEGVERGSFAELDSYSIGNKKYNLVMCDHHGPISNNDIEMVVLAFSRNKMQNYQPRKIKDKISEALGKGN